MLTTGAAFQGCSGLFLKPGHFLDTLVAHRVGALFQQGEKPKPSVSEVEGKQRTVLSYSGVLND